MVWIRDYLTGLLAKGQIGAAWYAILTGIVMLYLAYVLSPAGDTDPAAPYVAGAMAVTGSWCLVRGCLRLRRDRLDRLDHHGS
jgi:hypothetical protein